jgi:peptide deformylase
VARQGIRLYGDPILRTRCHPVVATAPSTRALVTDLFDTMYDAGGVGLAAPQIGVSARVFVADCSALVPGSPRLAVINPELVAKGVPSWGEEGCLSFPDLYLNVRRPEVTRLRYETLDGGKDECQAAGLLARVLLHELDHLDGALFVDGQNALRRTLLAGRLWNYKRRSRHGEQV